MDIFDATNNAKPFVRNCACVSVLKCSYNNPMYLKKNNE